MCADHALAYERKADDNDDLLAPALFFRAAAQAFKECLPPMPQTNLQTARVCVLSNMMRSRIELMLKPVYGEEAGALSSILLSLPSASYASHPDLSILLQRTDLVTYVHNTCSMVLWTLCTADVQMSPRMSTQCVGTPILGNI